MSFKDSTDLPSVRHAFAWEQHFEIVKEVAFPSVYPEVYVWEKWLMILWMNCRTTDSHIVNIFGRCWNWSGKFLKFWWLITSLFFWGDAVDEVIDVIGIDEESEFKGKWFGRFPVAFYRTAWTAIFSWVSLFCHLVEDLYGMCLLK